MAGIVPALKARDHIRPLREPVHDLALALVAPLGAHHSHVRHPPDPRRHLPGTLYRHGQGGSKANCPPLPRPSSIWTEAHPPHPAAVPLTGALRWAFFISWFFAVLLIAATYNPSFANYATWVRANLATEPALSALFGRLLVAGYLIYWRATLNSIGIILIIANLGALLWLLFSAGFLQFGNPVVNGWIVIVALSLMLAIGMSWSVIWRRMSGQVDVDEVDTT